MSSKPTRIPTKDGDWYVATSSRNWAAAFDKMKAQVEARNARMAAWELANWPVFPATHDAAYWDAYKAAKYSTPVDYPMPEGHVMFARPRHFCCEVCDRNPTCGNDCGSCSGEQFDPASIG